MVRAFGLHPKGHRFESYIFYKCLYRIAAIAGDCKSPLFGVRWFESICRHIRNFGIAGAYVGLKIQRNKFDSYRFHK